MGDQSASLSHPVSPACERNPQAVILVGFMGAGKTSVGKELAGLLDWDFDDLDERIQSRESRTVEEIFRESGEAEFRRYEHVALRELLSEVHLGGRVVALGGGAFTQAENAALVKGKGIASVFLEAPVEELFRRCQQQNLNRPLRQDETHFRGLYKARQPFYMGATYRVETAGKSVMQVAGEIARIVGLARRDPGSSGAEDKT